ncbi:MAG: transcriptional regulator [Pseudonocardiales bacterium]|nr:transcriptional regulator [Pseudonocardiales bacterium]
MGELMEYETPPDINDLISTFVSLADTLAHDFELGDLLDALAIAYVNLTLCNAAILLIADGTRYVSAASDRGPALLTLAASQLKDSPAIESLRTGVSLTSEVSADGQRWRAFRGAAEGAGFSSFRVLPMQLREQTIGAATLLYRAPLDFTSSMSPVAQALADVATIGLLQRRRIENSELVAGQLQRALNSRLAIEQAKGILSSHGRIPIEATFDLFRDYCRANRVSMADTAARVVSGELDPATVLGQT